MTFLKKNLKKIALVFLCLLLAGSALVYFYFIRIDARCDNAQSLNASACYAIKVLDIFPIARAELSLVGAHQTGRASLDLKITPIGLTAALTKGNRFELSSVFRADNGQPQEFTLSLYDRNGLRYAKTSHYDFENKTIRWEKSYPASRNKKNFAKEYSLAQGSLSPLSAFYLMTRMPSKGEQELKIQVQDIPYIARAIKGGSEGGVSVSTYAIGKDKGRVEAWRRRMDMELDLFFSCPPGTENGHGCLPFRITLPFRVITLTAMEKNSLAAAR